MGHTQGPSRLLVPTPSCQVPNSQDKATQGAHRAAACRCWAGAGEEQVRDEGQGSTSKGGSTGSHESSFPLLWHALVSGIPASLARVAMGFPVVLLLLRVLAVVLVLPHCWQCCCVDRVGSGREPLAQSTCACPAPKPPPTQGFIAGTTVELCPCPAVLCPRLPLGHLGEASTHQGPMRNNRLPPRAGGLWGVPVVRVTAPVHTDRARPGSWNTFPLAGHILASGHCTSGGQPDRCRHRLRS